MLNPSAFSCCLIGGDTLLSQCGEVLLAAGHGIDHVITSNPGIAAWAVSQDINVLPADSDYPEILAATEFDYLFAITHLALIPDRAVQSPRKLAINFHDGPLPAYAGLNTPMWAIINGEENYGVSWHVMTSGIDQGDLLLQVPVAIDIDETALSLNTKCFAAALESFPQLLDQLVSGALNRTPQDLQHRTYYGRASRPGGMGVLDWRESAPVLNRLIRGLNTGPYENTLASPKIVIAGRAYIVDSSVALDDAVAGTPGELIESSPEALVVRCGSGALQISGMRELDGAPVSLADLARTTRIGTSLTFDASNLQERCDSIARNEPYWNRLLRNAEAATLPYRDPTARTSLGDHRGHRRLTVPDGLDVGDSVAGAFALFLARVLDTEFVAIALNDSAWSQTARAIDPLSGPFAYIGIEVNADEPIGQQARRIQESMVDALGRGPWLRDLIARSPMLRGNALLAQKEPIPVAIAFGEAATSDVEGAELLLRIGEHDDVWIEYSETAYSADSIERMSCHVEAMVIQVARTPEAKVAQIDLLTDEQRHTMLVEWNRTAIDFDKSVLMHSGFEAQAIATPEATALVCGAESITYGDLNARADRLAGHLRQHGAGADALIGVYVPRSIELMVATLAVLKAGAAYVPLDPAFPADRIVFMIEDSSMPLLITHSSIRDTLPATGARIIDVDRADAETERIEAPARPENLAYVIYTSGSTGQPKGVMIEHRNVVNFFGAMDRVVPQRDLPNRTWLAVTSLSFDISVLELFWTLNRGFKVVIFDESRTRGATQARTHAAPDRVLGLGLFMWGNDDAAGPAKYKLLLEGARYFDQNGFNAVWTPERHFHAFGGPYPNPAVTGAAVAAVTTNVKIRAGSCVVPLHHPVRIAEEWSVVDNLSNGRVEIAAASGWNPNDFVLSPGNHADNKGAMYRQLDQVRRLWRGERVTFPGPLGDVAVESLPRPVQKELPCWITTAGNPDTWRDAGRLGLNVLTHLLGQSVEEIREKVHAYRQARAEAGHDPESGRVALMLHTFVGEDTSRVRDLVREPMKDYLASSMRLAMDYAWSFPAFKRPGGQVSKPEDVDLKSLSSEETDTILNFAFERYFETSGLFGDEDTCIRMLGRCAAAGVDEIACLMDFGVPTDLVLDSLPRLRALRDRMVAGVADGAATDEAYTFAQQVADHGVTHLQCTPSAARMYLSDPDSRNALGTIEHLMLGGEALPPALARELASLRPGTLSNMYGPTETTIWSLTSLIDSLAEDITIGRPIANTSVYVLDRMRRPVPVGIPGELYIGGDGVARGYLNRPDLTAQRFVADPFSGIDGARMYATGDLVAYREDATLDFLGRTDFQVKVRGYRIELGEIEARLETIAGISEAAVIVRRADDGDDRLVAFLTPSTGAGLDQSHLRSELRRNLPEYMVPNEFVAVTSMPRTANGKLDRKALQGLKPIPAQRVERDSSPSNDLEKLLVQLWRKTLKLEEVGLNENFFDLGGHSLLVVQLHGEIKKAVERPVSLTDLYQYPTIRTLSDYLSGGSDSSSLRSGVSRGERRRALRQRRAS